MESIRNNIRFIERDNSHPGNTRLMTYLYKHSSSSLNICLLLLRCTIGIILFVVGSGKVFGWFGGFGLETTLKFYTQMGISHPFAYMSIYTEFIGGFLLTIGLITRIASIAIIINMLVATLLSLPNGFLGLNGASYPFVFLIISISILLAGPMKLSIDSIIFGKIHES